MNGPSPPHTPAGGPRGGEGVAPVCLVATRDIWLRRRHREARSLGDTPVERAAPVSLPCGPPIAPWGRPRTPSLPRSLPKRRRPRPGLASPRSQHWPGAARPPGARAVASPLSRVSRAAGSSVPCGTFLALLLCPQRNVRTSVSPQQHKCLHGACPPSPARFVCLVCVKHRAGRPVRRAGLEEQASLGASDAWV